MSNLKGYLIIIGVFSLALVTIYISKELKINDLRNETLELKENILQLEKNLSQANLAIARANNELANTVQEQEQKQKQYHDNILIIEGKYEQEIRKYKEQSGNATCDDRLETIKQAQSELWETIK